VAIDSKTLQRKLQQLVTLANELDAEAKKQFGAKGQLFYEADGTFHIMDGDPGDSAFERQKHIVMSSSGVCRMGAGAW
jgi:hypothetical protein